MAASIAASDGESIVRIDDEDLSDHGGPGDSDAASVVGNQLTDATEVVFRDVSDAYIQGQDIPCSFVLGREVQLKNGDRIAIFRVPWSSIHDFVAFVWATDSAGELKHRARRHQEVLERRKTFEAASLQSLQADDDEYYQFCYVAEDGEILGSSSTFQIFSENKNACSTKTSVAEGCKSCAVVRGKLARAEALLAEKSSVSSFAPLNEAMAEDLQKLRERIRELSDRESALKEKLRVVDAEHASLLEALGSLSGMTDATPQAQAAAIRAKMDILESQRNMLELLSCFAARLASSGEAGVLEDEAFESIKDSVIAQQLDSKFREIKALRGLIEKKEDEMNEVKNELMVEKANNDELLKALSDEMEAKNRVLQNTIRDLQEQAKKNLEVIAAVGMLNHTRREKVGRYLRSLPEGAVDIREITATVMDILSQDSDSSPGTPVKQRSGGRSRRDELHAESAGSAIGATGPWESTSDTMQRSVSSQTSDAVQPRIKNADGATGMEDAVIEKVVPEVAEQVGSVLRSALQDALIKSYTSQISSLADAGLLKEDDHGDASDYESVASRGHDDETEGQQANEGSGVGAGEDKSAADSNENDDSLVHVVVGDDHVDESDATDTPAEERMSQVLDADYTPPIPEMMRRFGNAYTLASEEDEAKVREDLGTQPPPVAPQPPPRDAPAPTPFMTGQPVYAIPGPLGGGVHPPPHVWNWSQPRPVAVPVTQFHPRYVTPGGAPQCHPSRFCAPGQPSTDPFAPTHPVPPRFYAPSYVPRYGVRLNSLASVAPPAPGFIYGGADPNLFQGTSRIYGSDSATAKPSEVSSASSAVGGGIPMRGRTSQPDLPPPLLPQPVARLPHFTRPAPPTGSFDFMAEIAAAKDAALRAAANGFRAAADATRAGASAAFSASESNAGVGVRAAENAAAEGGRAASKAADEAARITRAATEVEKESLRCPMCDLPFPANDVAGLNKHVDEDHLQAECPVCGKIFRREDQHAFSAHVNRCLDGASPSGHPRGFSDVFGYEFD